MSPHFFSQAQFDVKIILPAKKMFGNMDRQFIIERQRALQDYINLVMISQNKKIKIKHPLILGSDSSRKYNPFPLRL